MTTSSRKLLRRRKGREGALTVEMALCMPILFMVLFGCYEIAHANMLLHASESAAYEGARVGIVPGSTPEKIRTAAGSVLRSMGIRNFTVTVTPPVITTSTETVKVDIQVPYRANTAIPAQFFQNPTFRGSCELNREVL